MQLRIVPTRLVTEVQEEFNEAFPFLRVVFFHNNGFRQSEPELQKKIPYQLRIGDCQAAITDGLLEIDERMKVNELEKIFKDRFRLNARILRRSGNLWLQTSMTDEWTLQKQNEHGMEISGPLKDHS